MPTVNCCILFSAKDEIAQELKKCQKDVQSWTNHLIRGTQQEMARTDAINNLKDETDALLIYDWSMKILPQKTQFVFGKNHIVEMLKYYF